MNNFFDKFKLNAEKEDLQTVILNIDAWVVFRGTNLWVLIFAIFVASLGLNVNSTAVIIGAMLISPLILTMSHYYVKLFIITALQQMWH